MRTTQRVDQKTIVGWSYDDYGYLLITTRGDYRADFAHEDRCFETYEDLYEALVQEPWDDAATALLQREYQAWAGAAPVVEVERIGYDIDGEVYIYSSFGSRWCIQRDDDWDRCLCCEHWSTAARNKIDAERREWTEPLRTVAIP